jgi:DGQHR domain-containing protein
MESTTNTESAVDNTAEPPIPAAPAFNGTLVLAKTYRDPLDGDSEETPKARYRATLPLKKLRGSWTVPRIEDVEDGYQRPAVPSKIRSIAKGLQSGGLLKGSVTLTVPQGAEAKWDRKSQTLSLQLPEGSLLRLGDGQHRLLGYEAYLVACHEAGIKHRDLSIQVEIYVGLTPSEEAALFEEINATQTKVSTKHLAEVRHRFGHETDVEAVASSILDDLSTGMYKEGGLPPRSSFLKLAKPLLAPSRGGRVKLEIEKRKMLLQQFLEAIATVFSESDDQSVRDSLLLNCVFRGACALFEEVLVQAIEQKFALRGVGGFVEFLRPLERFDASKLSAKQGGVVADAMREILFPILDGDALEGLLRESGEAVEGREENEEGEE